MRLSAAGALAVWVLPPILALGCATSAATFGDSGSPLIVTDSHSQKDVGTVDPPPKGDASEPLKQRTSPPESLDAGVDVGAAIHNCTATTSKPNPEGIGGYCTPGGGQCDLAGPHGMGTTCTADLPQAPPNGWFCTFPCVTAATCGTSAVCDVTPQGQECIPVPCEFLVDGGFPDATAG
jgi:hypothetical protein